MCYKKLCPLQIKPEERSLSPITGQPHHIQQQQLQQQQLQQQQQQQLQQQRLQEQQLLQHKTEPASLGSQQFMQVP